MARLGAGTLIPISAVVAVISMTAAAVHYFDGHETQSAEHVESVKTDTQTEIASIRLQLAVDETILTELRARQDKSDTRWEKVGNDLALIKERLGIVENRASK